MTRNRILVGCLWVTAATLALAQDAPPVPAAPPAPPAPLVTPALAAAPTPAAVPEPALAPDPPAPPAPAPKAKPAKAPNDEDGQWSDYAKWAQDYAQWAGDYAQYAGKIDQKALADQIKAATKMSIDAGKLAQEQIDAGRLQEEIRDALQNGQWQNLTGLPGEISEQVAAAQKAYGQLWAQQTPPAAPQAPTAPMFGQQVRVGPMPRANVNIFRAGNSEDRVFDRGESNLDNHNLDNALVNFNDVIARGASRADGALYYKAFTLNRMGRRDEATAAIAELRKTYPNSHWLEDAKALEADVKSGKSVSDEDDIKILALDGLMQNDPEKAFPILESLIKGAHVPQLKKQAVFVLAKNNSPRAQTLLEQIARGTVGDPDQQLAALQYVVDTKSNPARAQLLMDVYNGAGNDATLRSVVIRSFVRGKDYDHLAQIAKTEKNADLRREAIQQLGEVDGQPELWQMFAAETTPEGKRAMLNYMYTNGNAEKIADVARTDKDATVRRAAVQVLASYKGQNISTMLVGIYNSEQDPTVKKGIISSLADHKDAKSLIDIYRKEKDVEMRRTLMSNIIRIHSPEVNEFLLEILKP